MQEDVEKLQDIASLPYQVEFNIPVLKVSCGDLFSALLTVEGEIYTWGYNVYSQLGLNEKNLVACL